MLHLSSSFKAILVSCFVTLQKIYYNTLHVDKCILGFVKQYLIDLLRAALTWRNRRSVSPLSSDVGGVED